MELRLTLWGGSATSFDHSGNPVLAIKGCKVSDYSGVSLSALSSSVIQINPDIAKCHELKGIPGMMIYTLFEKLLLGHLFYYLNIPYLIFTFRVV